MNKIFTIDFKIAFSVLGLLLSVNTFLFAQKVYKGVCDASGAVRIDDKNILVVEDEHDALLLYSFVDQENKILKAFTYTGTNQLLDKKESDLEGGTRIGKRTYWIASHSRNKNGKLQDKQRHKLFALDLAEDLSVTPSWSGSYANLVNDLIDIKNWENANDANTKALVQLIDSVTQINTPEVPVLAPKEKGFNIEALSRTADGKGLYIGLRNPQFSNGSISNNAIIVQIKNPGKLIENQDGKAKFGKPVFLDLDGLGIRDMTYSETHKMYFIIAGRADESADFGLYNWNGVSKPVLIQKLITKQNVNPEAVIVHGNKLQILNDEGASITSAGSECKDAPEDKKSFSDMWINIPKK